MGKIKVCKECGQELEKNVKFCPACGRKNKKAIYQKWWFWLILAFVVIGSMGGNDAEEPVKTGTVEQAQSVNQTQQTPLQSEAEVTSPKAQTVFCVGDVLQDRDMKIVYMASGEYKEKNAYMQPEEGYQYIFLRLAVENTSDQADSSISEFSFECYADGYAAEQYFGVEEGLSATLSAGRSTTGMVCFKVPVDAEVIEVEYSPNAFLNDKITFVYEGEKDSGYVPSLNQTGTPDAHAVGEAVECGNLLITYLSCGEYKSNNQFIQPKQGYHYIYCEFEFANTGDSDEYISTYSFDCYADGKNVDALYIMDEDLSATLSSGRKTKGKAIFEVPDDAVVIEVEYLSNYWTSNRVVFTVD